MLPIAKLHDYHEKKRKHSMRHSALEEAMADVTIDNKSEVKPMDYEGRCIVFRKVVTSLYNRLTTLYFFDSS